MIHACFKDLSKYRVTNNKNKYCALRAYGEHLNGYDIVYVDDSLSPQEQRLCLVHEILELHLGNRISHKRIDQIAIDVIDGARQLGFMD